MYQRKARGILAGVAAMAAAIAGLLATAPAANAATFWNRPPQISGAPSSQVVVGQTYSFRPRAQDPEGRRLTFSIVNKPRWASFNRSTGRLTGTPGPSAAGAYRDIRIKVSDGRTTRALEPFSITVRKRPQDRNQAPRLSGTPPTSAREGQAYYFKPVATDADGDALRFSVANRPAWATFNAATGALEGTPQTGAVGLYEGILIRVSDGRTSASLPAFSIDVEQASMGSATLSWQAPTQRTDGSPLINLAGYRIRYGTDPDAFPNQIDIANPGITTYVITDLPRGTWYFIATAYDSDGRESGFSTVVSKTI